MRRSTILEGIHQESKLELSLFGSKTKNLENLLLELGIVYTNRAATYLNAIDNHIVGIGSYAGRIRIQQRYILWLRRSEGVVHSHEALLLVAPLIHREIYDPQT